MKVSLQKKLGEFALDVAFESSSGITALFGRSGAGKSLTINLLAGLMRPDQGVVDLNGRILVDTSRSVFVPPHHRRIGLVFQDSHLFPHLSVRQNLKFGRWFAPRGARLIDMSAVIETLGIGSLLDRRPASLSGGERQRVAIGRALLASPALLLLDEPLASLDLARKQEILPLIERVRDEFGVPALLVSHAIDEVARLADQVVMIENGHVAIIGTPGEVFGLAGENVAGDRFARASVLAATIGETDADYQLTRFHHPAGTIWLAGPAGPPGRAARIVIKATDVTLATAKPQGLSVRTTLNGRIRSISADNGPLATVSLALDGGDTLHVSATRRAIDDLCLAIGQPVFALIKTVALDERTL